MNLKYVSNNNVKLGFFLVFLEILGLGKKAITTENV